jgi:hypothetical protein
MKFFNQKKSQYQKMKENKSSILLCNQVPFLLKSPLFGVMNTQDQKINSLQKFIFKTCKNGTR